ncbi:exodeoxyribonuclease VII large subunit [Caviibacter abscessus]|uniref:exodeoxyribonuclease VII large subunit n=1 Tax=Caviibacter abscessus TaxID=1766719 RepID=UPI000839616E|nr:exodeoxyribonuclease VII large subunit [Caviibacter abscessus]
MKTYTVGEINNIIKEYLESVVMLKAFCVEGEVSNITYQQRHMYFTLKDEKNNIKCAGFNYIVNDIPRNLKEGDHVKVYGKINVYNVNATLQIVCSKVEKISNIGELYKKLEELKLEYLAKGYFDKEIKKQIPKYPKKIGVVTAHTGAAIHDIIDTTQIRNNNVDIYVYSAKVQGEGAGLSIAEGIRVLNNKNLDLDLIIVGRGGGSIEDLWAFNEREVIEAIYESKLPIISAVGHEVDVLLSDFAADLRAATPTQAAQLVVPEKKEILKMIIEMKRKLNVDLMQKLKLQIREVDNLKNNYYFKEFYTNRILSNYQLIDKYTIRLEEIMKLKLNYDEKIKRIESIKKNLDSIILNKLENKKIKIESLKNKLEKYNLNELYDRGFSITLVNNKLIKDVTLKKGMKLETVYKNGKVSSEVK